MRSDTTSGCPNERSGPQATNDVSMKGQCAMPRVILTITYNIKAEKRAEYLKLTQKLKEHFVNVRKKNYSVFEGKVKKNQFTEMFVSENEEDYEALDDNLNEDSETLTRALGEFIDGEGMKYNTLVETV